ncbi:hypothetical protein EJ110_NYTH25524 [Nymphaea thermarum]|nr:hypothetical protein EJ110_NYTH25524 [Nymphaea thermarum]
MDSMKLVESLAALLALVFVYHIWPKRRGETNHRPTEPGGAWPVVGHLSLLSGTAPLHRTLAALSEKHGPLFTLRLGQIRALIVSSMDLAKECFTINDQAFASRPPFESSKFLGYGCAMLPLAPYGPYWREVRKSSCYQTSDSSCSSTSELRRWALWWRPYTAAAAFFHLLGVLTVSDAIPCLEWLDVGGHLKAMKRVKKKMDGFASAWLAEHRRQRKSGKSDTERDFIDVVIKEVEDSHLSEQNSTKLAIALLQPNWEGLDIDRTSLWLLFWSSICTAMLFFFLQNNWVIERLFFKTKISYASDMDRPELSQGLVTASTDTMSVTIEWALFALLNNRQET